MKLDSLDIGANEKWFLKKPAGHLINLPGTLDDASLGTPVDTTKPEIKKDLMYKLTRKYSYIGAAWYFKEIDIPARWKNKQVQMYLERVLWGTDLWIDGVHIGFAESLSTPQKFNATRLLRTGKHLLTLRIDNRKRHDISVKDLAHAYTEGTQIIWNGVIGKMQLVATDNINVETIQSYPEPASKSVDLTVIVNNHLATSINGNISIGIFDKNGKRVAFREQRMSFLPGANNIKQNLFLGAGAKIWDEFDPNIYHAKVTVNTKETKDVHSITFGLRQVRAEGKRILVNDRPVFLRGTLECNIFPLRGYPPMNRQQWAKVFKVAKEYGLNHLRFHSWCPPKAAFEAADSIGFYLQVELPVWVYTVGADTATKNFIEAEALRIQKEYGNHPSFLLWSLGNELQGDFSWLNRLLRKLKALDNRHLYTTTTFTFQKEHGRWPEPNDDYFITQYTKNGWVRGQGIFNTVPPDFSSDYNKAVDSLQIPLITHEIGQYSIYPNLKEISRYQGVLEPYNLKLIRDHLNRKGMLYLADSFMLASGRFSANLYKEEIERALKTDGISGFQLLDLHDFPGQGTAHVGILDAFWDSKRLVSSMQHKTYCGPVVPLIRFPKAVYQANETFLATVEVSNYGERALNTMPVWTISDAEGRVLYSGTLGKKSVSTGGRTTLGKIQVDLSPIKQAKELNIEVSLKGTPYKNKWNIWVYPAVNVGKNSDIRFTRSASVAIEALNKGETVLFNPDTTMLSGIEGRFAPVFWSPMVFPAQPGTMGILCNPAHKALRNFPTKFYSDWQWWDLITSSKTMVIDDLPQMQPIVRVVDNFYKNRKMANVIEAKLGKGKILMTSLNISDSLDKRPAARQLRYSLEQYVSGNDFTPETTITESQLLTLLKKE